MAETPLPPGTPGSPDPASGGASPAEPATEAAEASALTEPAETGEAETSPGEEPNPGLLAEEDPTVEGWSGTPVAVSTEEAIARPAAGPIEVSLTPSPAPGPEAAAPETAAPEAEPEAAAEPAPVADPAPAAEPTPAAPAPDTTPPAEPEPASVTPEAPPADPVAPPPATPTIAATLDIPAAPGAAPAEGGEFDLLIEKVRTWTSEADIPGHWQKLRGPLKGFALLLVAVLALRLYARVIGTLDGIPIVSGLLELTGLIYLVWFSATRLVRTSERERVLAAWKERWESFSGRS